MRRLTMVLLAASIGVAAPAAGRASEVNKVGGKIRSVDAEARLISVSPAGGKAQAVELEVSRKARITVEGGEATLDDLRAGQEVMVTYEPTLGVATEIRATGAGDAAPEVGDLAEINTKQRDFCPWLSPDGLTIYWVTDDPRAAEGEVWTARRKDAETLFADKRRVGHGRHIAVSADGLTLLLTSRRADGQAGDSIKVANRRTADEPFGRPREVAELKAVESPRNLFLSADGLTLLFVTGAGDGEEARLWQATRRSPQSRWAKPMPLVASAGRGIVGHVICPHLTADGLTLLGVVTGDGRDAGPRIMKWGRKAADAPFTSPSPLKIPGVEEFAGWQPRYAEATKELFFASISPENKLDIRVVRNFTP